MSRLARIRPARVALLLLAALLSITLLWVYDQRLSTNWPSANSVEPSGTKLFADILRQQGIPVEVSHALDRQPKSNELVIRWAERVFDAEDSVYSPDDQDRRAFSGRPRTITFSLESNFDQASAGAAPQKVKPNPALTAQPKNFTITRTQQESGSVGWPFDAGSSSFPVYVGSEEKPNVDPNLPFVTFVQGERENALFVSEALFVSNRWIGKEQNAEFAVQLIRMALPSGGTVVFDEASFGNGRIGSLFDQLGPWMRAFSWQFWFLFAIVCWSLGIVFGRPQGFRHAQRGSRDMIEAFAFMTRRAKAKPEAYRRALDRLISTETQGGRRSIPAAIQEKIRAIERSFYQDINKVQPSDLQKLRDDWTHARRSVKRNTDKPQ